MADWLLIDDGPADGARNMAVDEFLLDKAERKGGAAVLRLYSFHPPAITLGYHQDPAETLDLEAAEADGLEVIRRITGGRALLHEGELSYSVAAPIGPPFGRSLRDTFVAIADAIVAALRSSGVDACIGSTRRTGGRTDAFPPCLSSAGRYEVTASGMKISGSAQRRTRSSFLQHGSIFLRSGSERIEHYLRGGWNDLARMMTTVEAETGGAAEEKVLRGNIVEQFGQLFGCGPGEIVLDGTDMVRIEEAAAGKVGDLSAGKAES
jgi:lipoate-protein ligase A